MNEYIRLHNRPFLKEFHFRSFTGASGREKAQSRSADGGCCRCPLYRSDDAYSRSERGLRDSSRLLAQ